MVSNCAESSLAVAAWSTGAKLTWTLPFCLPSYEVITIWFLSSNRSKAHLDPAILPSILWGNYSKLLNRYAREIFWNTNLQQVTFVPGGYLQCLWVVLCGSPGQMPGKQGCEGSSHHVLFYFSFLLGCPLPFQLLIRVSSTISASY